MSIRVGQTIVGILLAGFLVSACTEESVVPPVTPSPLPTDKVQRLAIACPSGVQTQSFDGQPVSIGFGAPLVTGGQAPVTSGCAPVAGSPFTIGTTSVICSAQDRLLQTASCSLSIVILGPPKLSATTFLAFGDSLTSGFVAPAVTVASLDPTSAYPFLVQRSLAPKYVTQIIRFINAGSPGEEAINAVARFRAQIVTHQPDAVFLMEGTNDLDVISGSGASAAAAAVDTMVREAIASGIDVFLMTIPPQRGTASASDVPGYNNQLRSIALGRGATLIDVYNILLTGACPGAGKTPCIGNDGLHPTSAAYQLVATEVERVILDRYDVEILPTLAEPSGPGGRVEGDRPETEPARVVLP